jgi:hypothetical protein
METPACAKEVAARLGLEPRQAESESAVLPLHHQAVERGNAVVGKAAGEWSRRRESNLQPPVYKTGALPLSYAGENESPITGGGRRGHFRSSLRKNNLLQSEQQAKPQKQAEKLLLWWLPGDSNPEPID